MLAAVPYNPVPDVAPQEAAPADTLRVNPTASSFGGAIAQGAEQLGAGATKAGQFFGQVAADQASNNFQQQASELVTNYKALKGQAAIDARPQVEKNLDDLLSSTRSNLTTAQQNLQFDDFSRRYRTYLNQDIGQHYDQQTQVWSKGVNDETLRLNLGAIAANPDDREAVNNATSDVINAHVKNAQLQGLPTDAAVSQGRQVAAATQIEAIGVKDPNRALGMTDKYRDILGTQYPQLYDKFKRAADVQFGQQKTTQHFTEAAVAPASGAVEQPAQLLRSFEGFRSQPYRDNDGRLRVGYGSDTVTRPDGSIEPVTSFTQVTREDAERDLQRRTQLSQGQAAAAVGENWGALTPAAKASLTSVAYNYGHLPSSVAVAAQTGDPAAIANSIASLQHANGGVNAGRRQAEAANVLGKFTGPGGSVTPFGGAALRLPNAAPAAPTFSPEYQTPEVQPTPASYGAPSIIPPAAPLPPPVTPPNAPTPEDIYAQTIQKNHQDPELVARPAAMAAADAQARELYNSAAIAAEATARAQKQHSDEAVLGYSDTISKIAAGQFPLQQAPELLSSVYANHALSFESKNALASAIRTASGGAAETPSYGPAYTQALAGLTAPPGDVNGVHSPDQLVQLLASGGLSQKGFDNLYKLYSDTRKNPEAAGAAQSRSAVLSGYKTKMVYDATPLYPGQIIRPDKEGEAAYDMKFVPAFNSMYDKFVADGGNPYDFMLDPKNLKKLDDLANSIRPKAQVDAARVGALDDSTGGVEAPNAPLPPPPQGADPAGWNEILTKPPLTAAGTPLSHTAFANKLNYLLQHPDEKTIQAFDNSQFGKAGLSGRAILNKIKKFEVPPGVEPPLAAEEDHVAQ